jgi:hypothetical protein
MHRARAVSITGLIVLIAAVGSRSVDVAGQTGGQTMTAAERCSAVTLLAGRDLPNPTTRITSATHRPAAAAQPAGGPVALANPVLPEHCEVIGQINDRMGITGQRFAVNFRLRLPSGWNGRFFFQGGGGTNGAIGNAAGALQGAQPVVALALGYAVVSQDAGHDNATNDDPQRGGTQSFGFDPQARLDFGYRSYDEVTRAAKALIERHYGRGPDKSYYVGCSEGGREGLVMSQRFPAHFDGVLSCAPALHLPQAALAALADTHAFATVAREAELRDEVGLPLIQKAFTDDDLLLVSNAVLAACDRLDDLEDGMIQNFPACTDDMVTPRLAAITCAGAKTPECLSRAQVLALERVIAGATTRDGTPIYAARTWDAGFGGRAGNGYNQGWRTWKLGSYNSAANSSLDLTLSTNSLASIFMTPPVSVATSGVDQVAFGLTIDLAQANRMLGARSGNYRESALEFMKADATDLSAFRARGGKLILVHGVSDPVFSITDTITWWTAVNEGANGTAPDFARLFAVPGMNHCGGGPSTDQFNAFAALVDWVEKGSAPARIVATARASTPWPGRTRPLCPYPQQARYSGNGSIEDAASFVCRRE